MCLLFLLLLVPTVTAADSAAVYVGATIVSSVTVEVDGRFARAEFFGTEPQPGLAWATADEHGVDVGVVADAWVEVVAAVQLAETP